MQREVVNGAALSWKMVTRGVPQGLVLETALFDVFINYLDKGIKGTLGQFADDTKFGGNVTMVEGRKVLQGRTGQAGSRGWGQCYEAQQVQVSGAALES